MGNILVATLGMSPGVVTKTAYHIHKEKGILLASVVVVFGSLTNDEASYGILNTRTS